MHQMYLAKLFVKLSAQKTTQLKLENGLTKLNVPRAIFKRNKSDRYKYLLYFSQGKILSFAVRFKLSNIRASLFYNLTMNLGEIDVTQVTLIVNGTRRTEDVSDYMLLADFIREKLKLTGTHIGCDTSQCGACVIHIDEKSVKSCTMLAVQADGSNITTIEGLSDGDVLHPMQQAFHENHGLQCGFCTPGMIMSAIELIDGKPDISETEIRQGLEGNLCRCTGYQNIVKSIKEAAKFEYG